MSHPRFFVLRKMWQLLDSRERKMAFPVVLVMMLAGFASVGMVGAVMPFLYVLAHPELLVSDARLAWVRGLVDSDIAAVYLLGVCALIGIVLAAVLGMFKVYVVARYTSMRAYALSLRMLQLQLAQPYVETASTPLAITTRRVIREPGDAIMGYLMPLGEAIASAIAAFSMLVFLLWFNVWATVILVSVFLALYLFTYGVTKSRLRAAGERRIAASTRRAHTFNEAMRCFREVRMSAQEGAFTRRFSESTREENDTRITAEVLSRTPRYAMQSVFFMAIVLAGMVLVGRDGAVSGESLIAYMPTVGVFMFAGQRMLPEIQNLFTSLGRLAYGAPSVLAVHEAHAHMVQSQIANTHAIPLPLRDSIRLEAVVFRYPDRSEGALLSVDLTIPKGQKVGLVGPSGSGKSTLAALLMGLMPPTSGRILIDGIPLSDNPSGWRLSVAQVPQDVVLVAGSVRANVALGEEQGNVDDTYVRAALRAAHLDEVVDALPHGLGTDVMTGIASLSGGQRQRLGLARAFYRNADVLVLDEATSALDDATEAAILSEIEAATKGKTVISVAHRLGTLRGCDRIVALDAGRIVFDGDWEAFRTWKARSEG